MKKLFLLPFVAMFGLVGCGGDNPGGGGGGGEGKLVAQYDFSTAPAGSAIALEGATEKFASYKKSGDASITVTAIDKVYEGNGSGGAKPDAAGLLKFGTSSVQGKLVFTVSVAVTKVVLNCHSFYKPSDQYPTNTTNFVKVNTLDAVALPYNAEASGEDLTFNVSGSEITILTVNAEGTGAGRGCFYSISLYA